MRLRFDRGTLLLEGAERAPLLDDIDGLRWDARVAAYRATAAAHARLRADLRQRGVRFSDEVAEIAPLVRPPEAPALRPYQEAALEAWALGGRRGIVVLPTGSGKTRTALAALARCGHPALCLVPTRVLLHQWRVQLGPEAGVLGDGERRLAPITVATFESAYRHMGRIGDRFRLLVVDEAHHFGAGQRDEALEMAVAPWRLGLTATLPSDPALRARLAELIGPVVYELGVADLAGSYLANLDVITLHLALTPDERSAYEAEMGFFHEAFLDFCRRHPGGEWPEFVAVASRSPRGQRAILGLRRARRLCAFPAAKQEALSRLLDRHRGARILVFTSDTATAYRVARRHLVMPVTAEIGREERDRALEHFRSGALRVLVACRVLNEGLDVPDAEVAIVLGGALGGREHVQRVGRLLRPRTGKRALVYDLVTRGTFETRQALVRRRALGVRGRAQL